MAYSLSFLQNLPSFSKILWCLNWTTRCYTCSVLHTAVAWWKPADSQSWLARHLTAQTLKAWKLNLVVHLINKPRAFLLIPHYKWSLLLLGMLWYQVFSLILPSLSGYSEQSLWCFAGLIADTGALSVERKSLPSLATLRNTQFYHQAAFFLLLSSLSSFNLHLFAFFIQLWTENNFWEQDDFLMIKEQSFTMF